jgi:hypothetical protein
VLHIGSLVLKQHRAGLQAQKNQGLQTYLEKLFFKLSKIGSSIFAKAELLAASLLPKGHLRANFTPSFQIMRSKVVGSEGPYPCGQCSLQAYSSIDNEAIL